MAYRLPTWLAIVINLMAASIAIARVAAPETTFALLPTGETLSVLNTQLKQALDIVRNGIEPVIPVAGLVVILLALFWVIGFLFAWGLSTGHPYVALLPALVVALQFATMDRQRTSVLRAAMFVAIVAAALLAVTLDQRQQTSGRMVAIGEYRRTSSRLSRSSSGLLAGVVLASAFAVTVLNGVVPADGVINWRSPTGLTGDFHGSIAYNPFVSIKQSLINNSNAPVFAVHVQGDVPADQIYFSLLTMENYSGGQFSANRPEVVPLDEEQWQLEGHAFAGPVDTIVAEVEIQLLSMDWLPSASVPIEFASADNIKSAVRVRTDDGALRFEGGLTFEGMRYQVAAEIPNPDVNVLAAGSDGQLSPAFQLAAAANEPVPTPVVGAIREEPPNVESFIDLPDDLDTGIAAEARSLVRNLTTPFEKGIALESWFRSPAFRYSTDITPGHGATDLADWLLDSDSVNYRTGYCENFATSMAVMARTLDIPSRVVLGFTPGTPQRDGTIIVRDRNAHAWVELWMPSQGWVRFDPTPRGDGVNPTTFEEIETSLGFPLTNYLDVPDPEPIDVNVVVPDRDLSPFEDPIAIAPVGGGGDSAGSGFSLPGWVTSVLPWLTAAVVILGGIPIMKWWRRRRRMRRLRTGDISAAWEAVVARLDDLGTPPNPTDTPAEVAVKVDPAMTPLATVYARSLYGGVATLPDQLIDTAKASLTNTEQRLATRHSRMERLIASYRLRTLVPRRFRNRRRRNDM
ncbi:MAG: transglutaminase domain-containing protein [bacterium]|nr:transglutaminase domain-containing protein [bacterium]